LTSICAGESCWRSAISRTKSRRSSSASETSGAALGVGAGACAGAFRVAVGAGCVAGARAASPACCAVPWRASRIWRAVSTRLYGLFGLRAS
jgi:hypothetical protein